MIGNLTNNKHHIMIHWMRLCFLAVTTKCQEIILEAFDYDETNTTQLNVTRQSELVFSTIGEPDDSIDKICELSIKYKRSTILERQLTTSHCAYCDFQSLKKIGRIHFSLGLGRKKERMIID